MKTNKTKPVARNRRTGRAAAGVGTVAAAVALLATAAQAPALAQGAADPAPDVFSHVDYGDCPTDLPAGVDRSKWRCEVTVGYSHVKLGGISVPDMKPITLTHAEGPLPDGTSGQVFGTLRADATPVPGGLLGRTADPAGRNPLLGLAIRPEYGGYADFLGTGTDKGALDLKFRLVSPLLGERCTIGTDARPVALHLQKDGPSTWLSKNPPLVRFNAYDQTLTVPAAADCGPLTQLVNHRFGLPAETGESRITYTAYYTFKTYDQLPAA
ncbi:hypothetical protein [Streptomyces sp. BPTC-684]|uniref:hypothetical protein n=1 Tax=Streptomyces sp. BPTC-684 TaxID=3043734 RepID=UPI0024B0580C|nr:hypothetical protein [Streptomyces sp. BPTC-684]WHM40497.1 hypothetical protein QIY60_28955 [Streptomyces sp. BPTC-684]